MNNLLDNIFIVDKGVEKWGPVRIIGRSVKWYSLSGGQFGNIHENFKFKYPLIECNYRNLSYIYLVKDMKMYVLGSIVCIII